MTPPSACHWDAFVRSSPFSFQTVRIVFMSQPIDPSFRPGWAWLIVWALLGVVLFVGLHLWQANDPVAEAAGRGVQEIERRLAELAPEELRSPASRLAAFFTDKFVRPHAEVARVVTSGWGLIFGVIIPLAMTFMGALLSHGVLTVTGGASGGWRETLRVFAFNRIIAEVLSLALVMAVIGVDWGLALKFVLLFFGLPLIRIGVSVHLTVALCEAHRLGVGRVLLLGVPGMLAGGAVTALLALIPAAWFWLHCALAALLAA